MRPFSVCGAIVALCAAVAQGEVFHVSFRDSLVRYDAASGELAFSDVKAPGGTFATAKLSLPAGAGAFKSWHLAKLDACETGTVVFAEGSLGRETRVTLACGYGGISVVGARVEGLVLAGAPDAEAVFAVAADTPPEGLVSASGGAVPDAADAVFDRRTDTLYRVRGGRLAFDGASGRFSFAGADGVSLSVEPRTLATRYRIAYRPVNPDCVFRTPPVGWMTWYAVKFKASDEVVMRNARGFMEHFRGYTDERPVMWVDWEWSHDRFRGHGEDGEDVMTPRASVYPRGLKPVAEDLEKLGFTPALWVALVSDIRTNALWAAHREWMLGEAMAWCGPLWGDPTAPGFCEEYVPSLFRLYQDWGYKAFKWDCLPAALDMFTALHDRFKDPSVGPEEAFRRMIAAGRKAVGPNCYLESCSGESDRAILGAVDLFDSGRVGGDIFKWHEFLRRGVNKILRYYPLHSTAFWADADNLVMREEFSTLAQARTRATVYALAGVPVTLGDEIESLDAARIDVLKRVMPVVPMHPASLRDNRCDGGLMESTAHFARPFGTWRLKAWSNFTTNETRTASFDDRGCAVWDFWNDRLLSDGTAGTLPLSVAPGDTALWRVTPVAKDAPTLVSVSRHVTQGGYEIAALSSDAAGARGTVKCPGGETVKVTFLLPAGAKVASASHPYALDGRVLRLEVGSAVRADVPFSFALAAGREPPAGGPGAFELTVLAPRCFPRGGAGLCVVMRTPSGKTYLFDTANGDAHGNHFGNSGRDLVVPWLEAHGVAAIDGLVISHYHGDHFGGFLWMKDRFPIRRIFNNGYLPDTTGLNERDLAEYRAGRRALDEWAKAHPGGLVENLKEGDDLGWNEPGVTFDVVWPPRDGYVKPLADRKGYAKGDNPFHHLLNANSNALRIEAFGQTFFIMGDIQADYMKTYMRPHLQRLGKWGCDFAVLPSHGTKPEETSLEIATMSPCPKTVAASLGDLPWMVNCGRANAEIYGKLGCRIHSTCLDGDLTVSARP